MKKLLLNTTAIFFVGVLAANAQTPSGTTPSGTTPSMQQQPRSSDWSKVEPGKIPAPVQQSLRADKYKGWESNGLYYNKSTSQYSVDVRTGATPGTYYFDQSGKTVTASGSSPQQGTTGSLPRPNSNAPNNSGASTTPANPQ